MQVGCAAIMGIFLLLLVLGKCSQPNDVYDPAVERAKWDALSPQEKGFSPKLPPTNEGSPFAVPTDPQAAYRLLRWRVMSNNHVEAMTRRDGPSGTSFTRSEFSCASQTYRVLGEGNTRDEAENSKIQPGNLVDLVPGSIKDYTASFACRKSLE